MKRAAVFLTFILLTGFSLVWGASTPLPEGPRFDQPVEFKTGTEGESLRAMIAALAKAVDLTAVVDDVPDTNIVYDIGNPKPFRQVWDIVLTLNNLDYALLENDVIVVGTTASISRLSTQNSAPNQEEELVQRFYRVNNDPNEVAQIISTAVPGVEVSVLESVKSLSVLGTQAQQDQVQSTLDQFDTTVEVTPLEQRIYYLSNAKAESLAQILQDTGILSTTSSSAGTDGSGGDSSTTTTTAVISNFTVVAEPRTNSIIVTATPAAQARLAQLIPQLDIPQQQVNIQVRIQEITKSAASNLGINLTAGAGNFATSILDTGLKFIFDAQNAISGLNIGAVLDTLETQGLSRRVDDSNLTVLNNGTATIQSGGTIFITLIGGSATVERTIPYGVQVDVTPRIANDGRVTVEVSAKVEDILSETADPNFLNLSTRRVSSTVTLEPGQTAVLAGLLQNSLTQSVDRVPVLGSIPVIGALFSDKTVEENNTELLLIINAMVIE